VLTTKANPAHARHANLLCRRFKTRAPNRVWVGDVTSVWTFEGWLYLAVIIDLYSRRVIGWAMGPNCRDELTIGALQMALVLRKPKPGLMHHTDRGAHYTS
jgi:transposase InsO family protein